MRRSLIYFIALHDRPFRRRCEKDTRGTPGRRIPMTSGRKKGWEGTEREVSIDVDGAILEGTLSLPKDASGIVLFAHGSGSSRHSPRNRYVAGVLQSHGIATLLFDLLTREEESVDQWTA